MQLSAVYAEIRRGLGYRTQSTNGDAALLAALQAVQRDLESAGRTYPRFMITEDATLTGVANVSTANLPATFLRLVEDEPPFYTGGGVVSREVEVGAYRQLVDVWTGSSETTIFAMAIRKSSIKVFPTPSAAWTITYSYFATQTALTGVASEENTWLLNVPDLFIAGAGLRVAADLGDVANMQKFGAMWKQQNDSLRMMAIDEELQDQTIIMGGDN